jgi:hypothetical protein
MKLGISKMRTGHMSSGSIKWTGEVYPAARVEVSQFCYVRAGECSKGGKLDFDSGDLNVLKTKVFLMGFRERKF